MSSQDISLIYAVGPNNEFGNNDKLPWKSRADLKYFRDTTTFNKNNNFNILVMGKNTFLSLPQFKCNKRKIIIVSKSLKYEDIMDKNNYESILKISNGLNDALEYCQKFPESNIFVIGGISLFSEIYENIEKFNITKIYKNIIFNKEYEMQANLYFDKKIPENFILTKTFTVHEENNDIVFEIYKN